MSILFTSRITIVKVIRWIVYTHHKVLFNSCMYEFALSIMKAQCRLQIYWQRVSNANHSFIQEKVMQGFRGDEVHGLGSLCGSRISPSKPFFLFYIYQNLALTLCLHINTQRYRILWFTLKTIQRFSLKIIHIDCFERAIDIIYRQLVLYLEFFSLT